MTAHAPAVSAVLRRAGFDRMVTETTSIPGYHRRYTGYEVTRGDDGAVEVRHYVEHEPTGPLPPEERAARHAEQVRVVTEMQGRYADALRAAGYTVAEVQGVSPIPILEVTKP